MKNWSTLEPDRVKLLNKHFSPGRGGHVGAVHECFSGAHQLLDVPRSAGIQMKITRIS